MRISKIINFLEGVQEREGDIKMQSVTGFWIETDPKTREPIVVPVVGSGKAVRDLDWRVAGLTKEEIDA